MPSPTRHLWENEERGWRGRCEGKGSTRDCSSSSHCSMHCSYDAWRTGTAPHSLTAQCRHLQLCRYRRMCRSNTNLFLCVYFGGENYFARLIRDKLLICHYVISAVYEYGLVKYWDCLLMCSAVASSVCTVINGRRLPPLSDQQRWTLHTAMLLPVLDSTGPWRAQGDSQLISVFCTTFIIAHCLQI